MNNLPRELAPVSDAAWVQIEDEARRTFKRWSAGRRVVDVVGPAGAALSAVGAGHLRPLGEPVEGVIARQREAQLAAELRVPFTVTGAAVDDVDRGARESDRGPVKDAVKKIALAGDHAVFHGSFAGGIVGIAPSSSNTPVSLPTDVQQAPDSVAPALTRPRFAGCNGPYSLLWSAALYTRSPRRPTTAI